MLGSAAELAEAGGAFQTADKLSEGVGPAEPVCRERLGCPYEQRSAQVSPEVGRQFSDTTSMNMHVDGNYSRGKPNLRADMAMTDQCLSLLTRHAVELPPCQGST